MKTIEGYDVKIFTDNIEETALEQIKSLLSVDLFSDKKIRIYTAGHPVDPVERNKGLEYAKPIRVGDNVLFGAHVCVPPGVTIGDNCVISAGSVVTKDIPSDSVAVGNP